jgi:hypothetical protein
LKTASRKRTYEIEELENFPLLEISGGRPGNYALCDMYCDRYGKSQAKQIQVY